MWENIREKKQAGHQQGKSCIQKNFVFSVDDPGFVIAVLKLECKISLGAF